MIHSIDLSGYWDLVLDKDKQGIPTHFPDTIHLPNTTSHAQKGPRQTASHLGYLTDEYAFEGWAWFKREIEIPETYTAHDIFLFLERTRISTLWIDGHEVGTQNSLCTPHLYNVSTGLTPGKHTLLLRIDNTHYPTKGGHLTSPDTQTNWNGITGKIELRFYHTNALEDVQIYTNLEERSIVIKGNYHSHVPCFLRLAARSFSPLATHIPSPMFYPLPIQMAMTTPATAHPYTFELTYPLGDDALLWDEYTPHLYELSVKLYQDALSLEASLSFDESMLLDESKLTFGLRVFKACGTHFTINGRPTFLRGKHDGLIFPLTGFAPTTVDEWLRVLTIAKEHGINHYRFHTCCPPEAAFEAADRLGIYMQPELPFWGTITVEGDENHDQAEQDYLIQEGFNMLKAFGNHPSFVMMSLGNELWGSQTTLNTILGDYKNFDTRHLYTQGSNNFQFCPCILENDDFFSGVRFDKDRLIRGSYAMCDAPLGLLQTAMPSTKYSFDEHINPIAYSTSQEVPATNLTPHAAPTQSVQNQETSETIEIQYGTGVKSVTLSDRADTLIPQVPVISHEVGQYETFPNFDEIAKYTGSIKAKNLEVFKERLEKKGLLDLAPQYFMASGKLAAACYKQEIEMALSSNYLAGFQLLDLQDFSGQGTALVGVLDAFMDSKGTISPEKWRSFCSDTVLLGKFESYVYEANTPFEASLFLSNFNPNYKNDVEVHWQLTTQAQALPMIKPTKNSKCLAEGSLHTASTNYGLTSLGTLKLTLPSFTIPTACTLQLSLGDTSITNDYKIMVYPSLENPLAAYTLEKDAPNAKEATTYYNKESNIYIATTLETAEEKARLGHNVLLVPKEVPHSIQGFYCTDFWCYPMFRSISESVNKPIPVGTMGLLINNEHPALQGFPSTFYSEPWWYNIVSNAQCEILDAAPKDFRPIVQMIDNFERNHKLGILYEKNIGDNKILVSTCNLFEISRYIEGRHFIQSLLNYLT